MVLLSSVDGGSFWHISDLHLDYLYQGGGNISNFCHQPSENDTDQAEGAGEHGDYHCDAPLLLVESSLLAMKNIQSEPDFIVWTGDSAPHWRDPAPPDQNYIFNVTKLIFSKLDKYFPGVPIVPALGNHDASPPDEFPVRGSENGEYYEKLWSEGAFGDHINIPDTGLTFHQCGYYTKTLNITQNSVWRFLVLNTNIYYHDHYSSGPDPCGQLQWMEETLASAGDQEKVFIVAHVPPGSFERIPGERLNFVSPEDTAESINNRYVDIVTRHSEKITAHLYGHLHTDTFRLILDDDNAPVGVAFMAGSVTPILWVKNSIVGVNPTIRLMQYDDETGVLTNYDEFYLDISEKTDTTEQVTVSSSGRRKNSKFRQDSALEIEEENSRSRRDTDDDVEEANVTVTSPTLLNTTDPTETTTQVNNNSINSINSINNTETRIFTPVPAVPDLSPALNLSFSWTKLYSAQQSLNVTDLTPRSVYRSFSSMVEQGAESRVFRDYYTYNTGGHQVETCDDTCWRGHVCTIGFLVLDKIQKCMNSSDISSFIESKSLILEADTTQSSATTTVTTSVPIELTTTTSTAAVDKEDSDSNNIQIQITSSTSSVKNENDHSHDSADDHDEDHGDDVGVTKHKIQVSFVLMVEVARFC